MSLVRDLRAAFVVDSDAAKAAAFADRMSHELALPVEPAPTLRSAVRQSDI